MKRSGKEPQRPGSIQPEARPFWRRKTLRQMSRHEWESLCDGCGQCCLYKLEDSDTGRMYYTKVACRLLDPETCRCRDYANRFAAVPDCVSLSPDELGNCPWLPETCAYRRLAAGRVLPQWHPLRTGDPDSVHAAGVSARGRFISEDVAGDLEDHVTGEVDLRGR